MPNPQLQAEVCFIDFMRKFVATKFPNEESIGHMVVSKSSPTHFSDRTEASALETLICLWVPCLRKGLTITFNLLALLWRREAV